MRCDCWQLLLDYRPIDFSQLEETITRKRIEYNKIVTNYFGDFNSGSVSSLLESTGKDTVNLSEYEKKNFK